MQRPNQHQKETRWRMPQEFNVLALVKGDERYVYIYDDRSRQVMLEYLQEQAARSELKLNWFDAAVLTEKVWEQAVQSYEASKPKSEESS
jgi:hypothetical protein